MHWASTIMGAIFEKCGDGGLHATARTVGSRLTSELAQSAEREPCLHSV